MFYFTLDHQRIAYQVAALINSSNKLSKKRSVDDIQNGQTNYVVETHGKWVLGAVGMDRQGYTFTEIKHLAVHSEWRGKGIAKRLLKRALALVTTKMVYATVREDNTASLKLFENLGFRNSGDYAANGHRVVLVVRVSPQWAQIKSGSKSHWLTGKIRTKNVAQSKLMSLELGEKLDPTG